MKSTLFLTLVICSLVSAALADKTLKFPKTEAVFSITAPEGWKSKFEEDRLYISTEDGSVIAEVSSLKATKQEGAKALEEMKASVKEAFRNVEFKPMQEGGANNLGLYILNGTGEDDDGKANLNAIMVTNGDNDRLFVVFIAASPAGSKEYGEEIGVVLASLKRLE